MGRVLTAIELIGCSGDILFLHRLLSTVGNYSDQEEHLLYQLSTEQDIGSTWSVSLYGFRL